MTAETRLGVGDWKIEKSVFQGAGAYAFQAGSATVVFAGTFKDASFIDFSTAGVNHAHATPVADLVDYCGAHNCPAVCNVAGSTGAHNVTADPLFANEAARNYQIPFGSPYRDAGTACVALVDPNGVAIPQGSAPDIGAYEWQPLLPPVTYTGHTRDTETTVIATDLQGQPLQGFDVYDLLPALDDPLVNLTQIALAHLFSDRRANVDDALPGGQTDRRGWVGDTQSKKIGSRLWQLEGRPVNESTAQLAQHFADESLEPLVSEGIATSATSTAENVPVDKKPGQYRLELSVQIEKQSGTGVIVRFPDLWRI
jgi:phage gp46-like protein